MLVRDSGNRSLWLEMGGRVEGFLAVVWIDNGNFEWFIDFDRIILLKKVYFWGLVLMEI